MKIDDSTTTTTTMTFVANQLPNNHGHQMPLVFNKKRHWSTTSSSSATMNPSTHNDDGQDDSDADAIDNNIMMEESQPRQFPRRQLARKDRTVSTTVENIKLRTSSSSSSSSSNYLGDNNINNEDIDADADADSAGRQQQPPPPPQHGIQTILSRYHTLAVAHATQSKRRKIECAQRLAENKIRLQQLTTLQQMACDTYKYCSQLLKNEEEGHVARDERERTIGEEAMLEMRRAEVDKRMAEEVMARGLGEILAARLTIVWVIVTERG